MPARLAACAMVMSPSRAINAAMPIGAIPKGADQVSANKSQVVVRPCTPRNTEGTNL